MSPPDRDRIPRESRLSCEQVATQFATVFIGLTKVDDIIDTALAYTGGLARASRAYLLQFAPGGAAIDSTHEWCASGADAQIGNRQHLPPGGFCRLIDTARAQGVVEIEHLAALPTEATAEREVLEALGSRSCVLVPIESSDAPVGFLAFDDVQASGALRPQWIELFRLIGRLIGSALERDRAYQEVALGASLRQAVLESIPDIAWLKDAQGHYLSVNQPFAEYRGLATEGLLGKTDLDIWPEEQARKYRADDALVMQGRRPIRLEESLVDPELGERWVETIKTPIVDAAGAVVGTVGIARDITERKRVEEALSREREKAEVTLHSIGDGVITTDADGLVELLNPVAESLTGWTEQEAKGRPLSEVFRIVDERTTDPVEDLISRVLGEKRTVWLPAHTLLIGRDGTEYAIEESAAPIRDTTGRVLGVVLVFKDVTEQRHVSRRMLHQATHDSLTDLVNRAELEKRLDLAIGAFHLHGTPYALCYLDLDQFKVVNDTAGHVAGDEMLRQMASLLKARIRSRDTLARLGGDEFILLLENCPVGNALEIAEDVVATVREYRFTWQERRFAVGVSVGVAPITGDIIEGGQLITRADIACYTAKDLGRDRVYLYQSGDSELSQRHHDMLRAAELREALENDLFRLCVQPIRATADPGGRILDHEVLLRLLGTDGNLLFPGSFLPAAERFGVMVELDRWVIREALRQFSSFPGGSEGPGIAINLSGSALADDRLIDFVRASLASSGVEAKRVCFELTETTAINRLAVAQRLISELRKLGCRFALDDFGSGLSSFTYLKHLPVDFLKIDGSFVRDAPSDDVDRAMLKAINDIGHTMGIATVAESVETEESLAVVRELGVDFAQGSAVGDPRLLEI